MLPDLERRSGTKKITEKSLLINLSKSVAKIGHFCQTYT